MLPGEFEAGIIATQPGATPESIDAATVKEMAQSAFTGLGHSEAAFALAWCDGLQQTATEAAEKAVRFASDALTQHERVKVAALGVDASRAGDCPVKLIARAHGVILECVQPIKWMRGILGAARGREAIKAASTAKARELTGLDSLSEHEADAVCIAVYGFGTASKTVERAPEAAHAQ